MRCRGFKNACGKVVTIAVLLVSAVILSSVSPVWADAPGPGIVYRHEKKAAPRPTPVTVQPESPPVAPVALEEGCDWGVRIAGGVPVWFFQDESTLPGAGAYLDVFNNGRRVNLRVGVEGRHMYLGQNEAAFAAEFVDKTPRITFLRIPFSVEYIVPLDEDATQLFLGGGPDIIHTANDIESTEVGGHLSARLLYNFTHNWGVAVEGGYMWAEASDSGHDVNLDGAYVTPTLNYTF